MILFRALNDFDILSDPLTNGLASKNLLYEITKTYYENGKNKEYNHLSEKEKDMFIKEHINEYIKSHHLKLEKKFIQHTKYVKETVDAVVNNHNPGSLILLKKYISTLQSHLNSGSKIYTDWISTSNDFSKTAKYYKEQDTHKIAVIQSNTNGIIDSDHIITLDISTKEKIDKNPFLCNKIDCDYLEELAYLSTIYPSVLMDFNLDYIVPTNPKARSFNYATSSNEVCIYKYIPSSHIISILESLQIDLINIRSFNTEYLKLSKREQIEELKKLKNNIFNVIKNMNDPYLLYIYEELYLNNRDINDLITLTDNKDKINVNRKKILKIARKVPNIQVKNY